MIWQARFGTCIYESPSGYKVFQNLFYRWLTLGSSALQTVINRRNLKKPVLHYLTALTTMVRAYPNSYCILGLGGAGVPHMLTEIQESYSSIAVDCSAEVIDIAKQFFMVDKIPNFSIVEQNALDYLKQNTEELPHLLVDLYDANHFPAQCATSEFFRLCNERIQEEGFVAINLANVTEQWPLAQLIKNQFANTLVVPVRKSANMIIIASKKKDKEWFVEKLNETKAFKKILWVAAWGYVGELV